MIQPMYFNSLIAQHPGMVRAALIIILIAAMAQFASFGLIQAHVVSFYGAQSEDVSFLLQITYAGIITTLPIQFRMVRYFNIRNYLQTAFLVGILLNIGCLLTEDIIILSIFRFMTGIITCIISGCMLISIFSTLQESKRILVGVSLFFSLVLSCGLVVGIGASWIAVSRDWTFVYYGLIGLQVVAMLLCMFVFNTSRKVKPYPLYQIDWYGSILFMFAAVATAFVMIYGARRYWFDDATIKYAAIFAAFMFMLFLFRQATLKRPLIYLNVFKHGKFIFATSLMVLFYGIKDSINLIYGYSAVVLGWSSTDVVNAGMFNIAGVMMATFVSVKVIMAKKKNLPLLLLGGFGLMGFYHFWLFQHLTPDLSFAELSIPIFLQGFACGLLFGPITVFCVAAVPQTIGMTPIIICAYARFIATLNSIAGFFTLQQNFNQHYKQNFLSRLIPESDVLSQRLDFYKSIFLSKGFAANEAVNISNLLVVKSSAIQGQLLTIRAIFFIGALLMAAVFLMLICFAIVNKVKAK